MNEKGKLKKKKIIKKLCTQQNVNLAKLWRQNQLPRTKLDPPVGADQWTVDHLHPYG